MLQRALALLVVHGSVACREGEIVEARWTDGTYKVATIMEVRDAPGGICGQYRLQWAHTGVCEDTDSEYWRTSYASFCLVSRDAFRKCTEQLCRSASPIDPTNQNSKSTEQDEPSDIYPDSIAMIIVGCLVIAACCVGTRLCLVGTKDEEVDEAKANGAVSPFGRSNDLWSSPTARSARSDGLPGYPSSPSSSPMAKWINTHKAKAFWPSQKSSKIVPKGEPDAAEEPEKWIGQSGTLRPEPPEPLEPREPPEPPHPPHPPEGLPGCRPGMVQTQDTTLRMAGRVYGPPPQQWRNSLRIPNLS